MDILLNKFDVFKMEQGLEMVSDLIIHQAIRFSKVSILKRATILGALLRDKSHFSQQPNQDEDADHFHNSRKTLEFD